MYHFHTSDQRKASAHISHIALAQNVDEICALYQCIYLINSRHCTPNRSAHYIQKSLNFFDVILLSLFSYIGNQTSCDCGNECAKQPVIVGFNFNTSTVVFFFFTFVNVELM